MKGLTTSSSPGDAYASPANAPGVVGPEMMEIGMKYAGGKCNFSIHDMNEGGLYEQIEAAVNDYVTAVLEDAAGEADARIEVFDDDNLSLRRDALTIGFSVPLNFGDLQPPTFQFSFREVVTELCGRLDGTHSDDDDLVLRRVRDGLLECIEEISERINKLRSEENMPRGKARPRDEDMLAGADLRKRAAVQIADAEERLAAQEQRYV